MVGGGITVLVCGGRDYQDRERVYEALDMLHKAHPITLVVTGGASGADALGRHWAASKKITTRTYPAEWKIHGKKAGPIRNQQMLDDAKPNVVLAFPGGRGTTDMITRAMGNFYRSRTVVIFNEQATA